MKVKLYVDTGYYGCEHIKYVNVPDNTTDEDLNDMAHELMLDNINYGFVTEKQAREFQANGIDEDFEFDEEDEE